MNDEYSLSYRILKRELERGRNNGLANEHAIELIDKLRTAREELARIRGTA